MAPLHVGIQLDFASFLTFILEIEWRLGLVFSLRWYIFVIGKILTDYDYGTDICSYLWDVALS